MAARRPDIVQGTLDVEVIAGDARPGEAHGPVLAAGLAAGRQRSGVEADDVVRVHPGDEIVDLLLERWGVVVAEHRARVAATATVARERHDGEPGRLGAAGDPDLALIPLEAPERRAHTV